MTTQYANIIYFGLFLLVAFVCWFRKDFLRIHSYRNAPRIFVASAIIVVLSSFIPYGAMIDHNRVTFFGFPFMVFAIDGRGRGFTGIICIASIVGNFLLINFSIHSLFQLVKTGVRTSRKL